jgi:uncharacterized membrane protein YqgA involved in biofilm formation
LEPLAKAAIGIGTVALGIKMFFGTRNVLIPIGALIIGGVAGHLCRIQTGIDIVSAWLQTRFGGGTGFQESFVTSSILFCAGPMTFIGCLEDGLEGKPRLLYLKSLLDGVSAVFFAAAVGYGVFFSALSVLVVQGTLTLGARAFRSVASAPAVLDEISAAGGLILCLIGLNLLGLVYPEVSKFLADYLPALVFAGAAAALTSKRAEANRQKPDPPGPSSEQDRR